jgi:hypothetical protein
MGRVCFGACGDNAATNILVFDSNGSKVSTSSLGKSQFNMYLQGNLNVADRNIVLDTDFLDGIAVVGDGNRVTANTIMNSDEVAVFVEGNDNHIEGKQDQ